MTTAVEPTYYEFETEPFTEAERTGLARFEAAVYESGLRDCFDQFDAQSIRHHADEFGELAVRSLLKEFAGYLQQWHLALDGLLGDMLTCTSEYSRYSIAAGRYLEAKATQYHRTRQDFEYAVTVWMLGLTPGALGDYPMATNGLDLGMQELTYK